MAFDSLYEAWMKAHYPSVFYEVVLNHYQEKEIRTRLQNWKRKQNNFDYSIESYEYGADNSNSRWTTKIIYQACQCSKDIGVNVVNLYTIAQSGLNDFVHVT